MSRIDDIRGKVEPLKAEWDRLLGDMMAAQNYSAAFPSEEAKRKELEISDAYNRVNNQLSPLLDALRRAENDQTELDKHIAQAQITADNENRAFWFKRFHTSLAIAHGAAFAAVSSKIFDKDATASLAFSAWYPLSLFYSRRTVRWPYSRSTLQQPRANCLGSLHYICGDICRRAVEYPNRRLDPRKDGLAVATLMSRYFPTV